ncbi:Metalloprotease [Epithele typhae]|uniref:Metalloprotease n=1 Tax=Epithele typhae TaxID=378194 RepID=UPI002008AEEF|nr:Metalloprotease [Epithele typhae]KAH9936815.1 Metalloprotease [Epithele typhae]
MFFLAFVTLAFSAALSLAGPATKRASALEVSLTAPTEVLSIGDIKISVAVTNTDSEDVKVLKYGSVLDGALPTRSFKVSKDGVEAVFTGVKLQVDMTFADDSAFIVIPAGKSVVVNHDVASLFDFESLGAGSFEFEPLNTFQVVKDNAHPSAYTVSTKPFTVNVKSDVQKHALQTFEKRAVMNCSSTTTEADFIAASYTESKSLAALAASYVQSHGEDALFASYFGTGTTSAVLNVLGKVAGENSSSRTLSCHDPYGVCQPGVIAYTAIVGDNDIYYCSIFYNEVQIARLCSDTSVEARNVRGGTTLHELTHATAGTVDVGYGCSFDMGLSANPAVTNADSYNCFATQIYKNTQC